MRKEALYAIIAGISIGLLTAFGIWKVAKIVKKQTLLNQNIIITPKPVVPTILEVNEIKDYDVINLSPFEITGSSVPYTDIVLSTVDNDYYTQSDQNGLFKILIELPAGISEININDKKIILIYSSEVTEKMISYVGTVTDISNGSIQIKSVNDGILQISVDDDTTYKTTIKKTEVKAVDLAIGDYIVAIGMLNNNKVLNSKRILITTPAVINKIFSEKIIINKLSKTQINDILLPKKWNGPNVTNLKAGQEIIIVGTRDNDKFTLRSIFTPVE